MNILKNIPWAIAIEAAVRLVTHIVDKVMDAKKKKDEQESKRD
jgi:hypothetical protein